MAFRKKHEDRRCSFCHKNENVVGKLISAPSDFPEAFICNECVMVCNSILDEETKSGSDAPKSQADEMLEHLTDLLSYIPERDLPTVEKILKALAVYTRDRTVTQRSTFPP